MTSWPGGDGGIGVGVHGAHRQQQQLLLQRATPLCAHHHLDVHWLIAPQARRCWQLALLVPERKMGLDAHHRALPAPHACMRTGSCNQALQHWLDGRSQSAACAPERAASPMTASSSPRSVCAWPSTTGCAWPLPPCCASVELTTTLSWVSVVVWRYTCGRHTRRGWRRGGASERRRAEPGAHARAHQVAWLWRVHPLACLHCGLEHRARLQLLVLPAQKLGDHATCGSTLASPTPPLCCPPLPDLRGILAERVVHIGLELGCGRLNRFPQLSQQLVEPGHRCGRTRNGSGRVAGQQEAHRQGTK